MGNSLSAIVGQPRPANLLDTLMTVEEARETLNLSDYELFLASVRYKQIKRIPIGPTGSLKHSTVRYAFKRSDVNRLKQEAA